MKHFTITANGTQMGIYPGQTAEDAVQAYARDAGYRDMAALAEVLGKTESDARAELEVELADA